MLFVNAASLVAFQYILLLCFLSVSYIFGIPDFGIQSLYFTDYI